MFRFVKRGAFRPLCFHAQKSQALLRLRTRAFHHLQLSWSVRLVGNGARTQRFCPRSQRSASQVRFCFGGLRGEPEHVHLLIGEPKSGDPSTVIHSLKLRVSKRMRRRARETSAGQRCFRFADTPGIPRFWQPRFYDFNVWSAKKRREKLEYMHRNPVTRGLVKDPKDWAWSSYASFSERGMPLLAVDFVH